MHSIGTVALVRSIQAVSPHESRVELDGVARARAETLVGVDLLIAEAVPIDEGDEGDEWGPAVEALARYLHAHAELRAFLEKQRRSTESMSWVNLACQHLPITATARQKLLEASAPERCLKISRGLDALLRKEQGLRSPAVRGTPRSREPGALSRGAGPPRLRARARGPAQSASRGALWPPVPPRVLGRPDG